MRAHSAMITHFGDPGPWSVFSPWLMFPWPLVQSSKHWSASCAGQEHPVSSLGVYIRFLTEVCRISEWFMLMIIKSNMMDGVLSMDGLQMVIEERMWKWCTCEEAQFFSVQFSAQTIRNRSENDSQRKRRSVSWLFGFLYITFIRDNIKFKNQFWRSACRSVAPGCKSRRDTDSAAQHANCSQNQDMKITRDAGFLCRMFNDFWHSESDILKIPKNHICTLCFIYFGVCFGFEFWT